MPVAASAATQKKKRKVKRPTKSLKPATKKKKKASSAISHPAPAAAAAPKPRSEHQGFQSAVHARVKSGLRTGTSMGEVSVLVGKWWRHLNDLFRQGFDPDDLPTPGTEAEQ